MAYCSSQVYIPSGTTTHNLRAFGAYPFDAAPPDWVKQFDDWLEAAIIQNDIDTLLDYRKQAPYATQNHPSDEHLLPLLVGLGAGGEAVKGTQLHAIASPMACSAWHPMRLVKPKISIFRRRHHGTGSTGKW